MTFNVHLFVRQIARHNYRTLTPFFIKSYDLQRDLPVRYKSDTTMPRPTLHVLNMQRMRQKILQKSVKYAGNANVSLQVSKQMI